MDDPFYSEELEVSNLKVKVGFANRLSSLLSYCYLACVVRKPREREKPF